MKSQSAYSSHLFVAFLLLFISLPQKLLQNIKGLIKFMKISIIENKVIKTDMKLGTY